MNTANLKTMTDEQIRLKIAERCGWHERPEPVGSYNATTWWHNNDRYPSNVMPVPDYLNDLNACHEMEKACLRPTLQDNAMERDEKFVRWDNYMEQLGRKMSRDDIAHATARQRCEAFLRTFGEWQ
jgi:hypothetical protein